MIRRARREDAWQIWDAHMRSIREVCSHDHTPDEISVWGNRPYNEEQRVRGIENDFIWVVELNGKVEGYTHFHRKKDNPNEGFLWALYLSPAAIGKGFGRQMMEEVFKTAKEHSLHSIDLESTITAHEFYRHFGFVDTGPMHTKTSGGMSVRCTPMKWTARL